MPNWDDTPTGEPNWYLDGEPYYAKGVGLAVCRECGAFISKFHLHVHKEWHAALSLSIARKINHLDD